MDGSDLDFDLDWLLVGAVSADEVATRTRRAEQLGVRADDPEALVLARLNGLAARCAHGPDPLRSLDVFAGVEELLQPAERSGRADLLLRVVQLAAADHYVNGRTDACDRALERADRIARRLGAPRFAWEVDLNRGLRCLDRGDRGGGEALVRRAGAAMRRLRPDIYIAVEMVGLLVAEWIFDGDTRNGRAAFEATQRAMPRGYAAAFVVFAAAFEGDREFAKRELRKLLSNELERLRRPDGCLPTALCALALAATQIGDQAAAAHLRPLLEPMRGRIVAPLPAIGFGHPAEWHLGRLELLAGDLEDAAQSLRTAVARADDCGIVWAQGCIRVDLAIALHRHDAAGAAAALAEGKVIGKRFGIGWTLRVAAEARAEIEGREPEPPAPPAQGPSRLRALLARGGRQVLATMVAGLDDAAIERRFAEPRSQRTLLKGMTQTFQPTRANGFSGLIAYELQPFAIEPPADAPWRWAMEIDAERGEARLVEPAPPETDVTIQIGLAEWVRVVAGVEDALSAIVAGRCSVEGDVILGVRLEAMFGGA